MSIKQVIVYRRDLKMRKGKIAAQAAHASMKVFFDRGDIDEDEDGGERWHLLRVPLTPEMLKWVEGIFLKVVLSVESEEDLLVAYEMAVGGGLPCALITDAGRTEFHGEPTRTCIAIGPAKSDLIDAITGPEGAVLTRLA